MISSRNAENVEKALKQLEASGIPKDNIAGTVCHVGNPEHRRHLVDYTLNKFGRIDILFNNAGINPAVGPILDVTMSQFDKIYDVNVKATFELTRMVANEMRKSG